MDSDAGWNGNQYETKKLRWLLNKTQAKEIKGLTKSENGLDNYKEGRKIIWDGPAHVKH